MLENLTISFTEKKGRGVFTNRKIEKGVLIERSPVIVMSKMERSLLDRTLLHDYIFEWGKDQMQCAMALGYVAIYNHSYESNCEYYMDFDKNEIEVRTVREIASGEELTINYNGDWNNLKRVWFDVAE